MGALTSRQNVGAEEIDIASIQAYKYPPKSGNYFGTHFIMGGERFDTPQPEAYLFGENADLNFLGSRPTPFPYPPPQANEPTKTLKSRVNIRKESLRMVKVVQPSAKGEGEVVKTHYNVEFMFDCDCRSSITIYYFTTEEMTPNGIIYTSKEPTLTSETYNYSIGANQLFCQPSHTFDPSKFSEEDLSYTPDKDTIPIAIHCVAHETQEETKQSHTTIAVVERHSDGSYVLKALKQKIFVDGLCYLLQEIYGIENKNREMAKSVVTDADAEDNGSECVICMSDVRDTLILPCRHLCLCNSCADSLRYQANNCPICRAPFRALLQIRALKKGLTGSSTRGTQENCENVPPGYEAVPLIEALNGPCVRITTPPESTGSRRKSRKSLGSPDYEDEDDIPTSEVRSIEEGETTKDKDVSPLLFVKRNKDATVITVDETQSPSRDEVEEEVDSEAEKLSPLLSGEKDSTNGRRRHKNNKNKTTEENEDSRSSSDSATSRTNLHPKSAHSLASP